MTARIYFEHENSVYYLETEDCEDVWAGIAAYDDAHGTDFWDHLDESNVLGIDCAEYSASPVRTWQEVE